MRAGRVSRFHRQAAGVAFAILAFGGAARSPASEPVPVVPPPTEDSITAAKRQLDALKSDANSSTAGVRTGALPSVAVPDFTPAPSPSISPSPDGDPALTKPKDPTNWLVDAMMKPKSTSTGDRLRGHERTTSREGTNAARSSGRVPSDDNDPVGAESRETKSPSASEAPAETSALEAPNQAVNPLTQYLSQWLSAEDYAVLRPTVEGAAGGARRDGLSPVTEAVSGLGLVTNDLETRVDRPDLSAKSTDNPYLQFLAPPDPAPTSVTPPAPPVTLPTPPAPDRAVSPPPPTALPDFVRPNTDDKYFKPLKRF